MRYLTLMEGGQSYPFYLSGNGLGERTMYNPIIKGQFNRVSSRYTKESLRTVDIRRVKHRYPLEFFYPLEYFS